MLAFARRSAELGCGLCRQTKTGARLAKLFIASAGHAISYERRQICLKIGRTGKLGDRKVFKECIYRGSS